MPPQLLHLRQSCFTLLIAILICGGCSSTTGNAINNHHRQLNTQVTQLLRVLQPHIKKSAQRFHFTNPSDGWVYIESTAQLTPGSHIKLSIQTEQTHKTLLRHSTDSPTTTQAMRWLAAGEHTLKFESQGNGSLKLQVRAIPQLGHGRFRYDPWIKNFGPYDWAYLQKHLLDNINCIRGRPDTENDLKHIQQWRAQGNIWLAEMSVNDRADSVPYLLNAAAPVDGLLIDELGAGEHLAEDLEPLSAAMRAVTKHGKQFNTYCYDLVPGEDGQLEPSDSPVVAPMSERGKAYVKQAIALGQKIHWERYLHEMPDEASAREYIRAGLKNHLNAWEKEIPDCRNSLVLVLSQLTLPAYQSDNTYPDVNWKYFVDMQCNLIANDPSFEGLHGIHFWCAAYATDEAMRWCSELFRHYFIEGNTEMLSEQYGYTYTLGHIKNHDFQQGLDNWEYHEAESESISTKSIDGYGKFQGRRRSGEIGDTFLWMRRSETAPNVITQQINNLTPGQLYVLSAISGNYQALIAGKDKSNLHGLQISVSGAKTLPERSFVSPQPSREKFGDFVAWDNPFYFNVYWLVFQAQSDTAELRISDWPLQDTSSETIGQELILNAIEIQPYFLESQHD